MTELRKLHGKRLAEGLAKLPELASLAQRSHDPTFMTWKERVSQSLSALFGDQHDYRRRFGWLQFQELKFRHSDDPPWDEGDERQFKGDLDQAKAILQDALDEFEVVPPPAVGAPRATGAGPAIVVNVHNVLSQTTAVHLSQIVAGLDDLALSESDREDAKRLAGELDNEAKGEERWPVMAKTITALKALGKPVYERVVVPVLLDLLKRQAGL